MKAPKDCPVCGDPMLNIFHPAEDLSDRVSKHCDKKLSHMLYMACSGDEVESLIIGLDRKNKLQAAWYFNINELWILDDEKAVIELPFFQPQLSDYHKLVDKVKTYLVFS
jgi:hypothetical protein